MNMMSVKSEDATDSLLIIKTVNFDSQTNSIYQKFSIKIDDA